jgi:hypothetical protein
MTWIICLVLAAAPQKSSPKERLKAVERAFDRYEYDKAVKIATQLFADPAFVDPKQRQQARLLLAFSCFLAGKTEDAAEALLKLFKENLDYPLDRDATHPDLLAFYDKERAKFVAALPPLKPPEPDVSPPPAPASAPASAEAQPAAPQTIVVAPSSTSPPPTVAAPVQVDTRVTLGDRHPWLRIFPLGIGHFVNHDYAVGGAFLALEVALVAANIALGIVYRGMLTKDGKYYLTGTNPFPIAMAMDVVGLCAIVLPVIDIIDAFTGSPARGRKTLP